MCWTEITWNAPHNRWDVERPTGPDYRCDIFEDEVQTAGQVGPINGQPPQAPRSPAPSTEDKGEGSEGEDSDHTVESGVPGNTTEEERLADLAESIHINPPIMATMTERVEVMAEEPTYLRREVTGEVDQHTGHRTRCIANIVDDEAALRQAQEPDRPDPPSGGPEILPELPPIHLPQDDRPARGFPGGGFPGEGGFPGGGVPGGGGGYPGGGGGPPGAGPPGGGWGPPPIQMPQPQQGKLVGETPTIYNGDRKNTQLFISQWELYWGVNNDNPLMVNPYR